MRQILVLLFTFVVISTTTGQEYSKKELRYKPTTLNEAVVQLNKIHPDSLKQTILAMTEQVFLRGSHFGLGMWIRNKWGLWKGKELAKYFNSIDIYHPDDMSAIILTSYYRELKGQNWEVDQQVKYYHDFWNIKNEHYQRLETDTAYRKVIINRRDSLKKVSFESKKEEWSTGKRISGYVDHRCGFLKDFVLRSKIEGTIITWKDDMLLLKIDAYENERKKKRIIKCYDVENDIILIEKHNYFHLIEE